MIACGLPFWQWFGAAVILGLLLCCFAGVVLAWREVDDIRKSFSEFIGEVLRKLPSEVSAWPTPPWPSPSGPPPPGNVPF
jgi:hypothetical protein